MRKEQGHIRCIKDKCSGTFPIQVIPGEFGCETIVVPIGKCNQCGYKPKHIELKEENRILRD